MQTDCSGLMGRADSADSALLPLSTFQSFLDEIYASGAPLSHSHTHEKDATPTLNAAEARQKKAITTTDHPLAPTNTRKGHNQRVKLLRREIHALRQQLKRLHDDHLDPNGAQTNVQSTRNWKRQAILESCMKTQSMDENKYLKKRLMDGKKLTQNMRELILKQVEVIRQIEAMTRLPTPRGFILLDQDTRTFATIKASMDVRLFNIDSDMHKRLRAVTTQCVTGAALTSAQWNVSNSSDGVNMSTESSALIPFDAEVINAAICGHVQVDTANKIADKISRKALTKNAAYSSFADAEEAGKIHADIRSMFRRFRNEYGFIIMWESISIWQSDENEKPKRAIARDHGWSIVAPAAGFAKDMSIGHSQMALKIQSMDEMPLQQEDHLATSIIRHNQQTIAAQSQLMENKLMDMSLCDIDDS